MIVPQSTYLFNSLLYLRAAFDTCIVVLAQEFQRRSEKALLGLDNRVLAHCLKARLIARKAANEDYLFASYGESSQ